MGNYPVRFGGGGWERAGNRHLASRLPCYSGSGPAQLSLALAADVLGDDDKAQKVYQRLKFLCGVPHKNFYAEFRVMRSRYRDRCPIPAIVGPSILHNLRTGDRGRPG